MESDLISRSAVEKILTELINCACCYDEREAYEDVLCELRKLSGTDAVPVVRCKDCDHIDQCAEDRWICSMWGAWTDLDGWCHKGERSEDNAAD